MQRSRNLHRTITNYKRVWIYERNDQKGKCFGYWNDQIESWDCSWAKSKYGSKAFYLGLSHSKWDLVGYSGGSPGLENAVKGGAGRLGRFVLLFTLMRDHIFPLTSEFTGLSIEAKCKPVKKYKRAREKRTSETVKSPFGVGRYCDMAVSPTISHLLWWNQFKSTYFRRFF